MTFDRLTRGATYANEGSRTRRSRGPTVSVAMATFNGERYLKTQLDTIARQSVLPTELVVSDDGSNDQTLSVVADFARSAPFQVTTVRNETRLGFADNFLQAARLCEGDAVAYADQDDFWLSHKLEVCAGEL